MKNIFTKGNTKKLTNIIVKALAVVIIISAIGLIKSAVHTSLCECCTNFETTVRFYIFLMFASLEGMLLVNPYMKADKGRRK